MLLAVAAEGNMVCPHFGHCEAFRLYETEDKSWKTLANPGHEPGFLPGFLAQHGVKLVITGGMGSKAQELFTAQGIKTIVGVSGKLEDAIAAFEKDSLKSSGEVCSAHDYSRNACDHEN